MEPDGSFEMDCARTAVVKRAARVRNFMVMDREKVIYERRKTGRKLLLLNRPMARIWLFIYEKIIPQKPPMTRITLVNRPSFVCKLIPVAFLSQKVLRLAFHKLSYQLSLRQSVIPRPLFSYPTCKAGCVDR